MRLTIRHAFLQLLLLCLLALTMPPAGFAAMDFESLEQLTPGEQYRRLSLLMLVAGGTEPALLDMLQPVVDRQAAAGVDLQQLELDDYVTPLIRIVDQDTLLASAARLFRFANENGAEIQQRLTQLARDNPILISMLDVNELAADAIIIRSAIADSIEYSEVIDDPGARDRLVDFRGQTVYLRNMMEFNIFQEDLAAITNQAIIDLGGRLDAYQRMFNDEVDEDLIKRRVESAEIMNQQTGRRYEDQAMARNAELLMMLILMESQVRR
jgi:hypothetical protein